MIMQHEMQHDREQTAYLRHFFGFAYRFDSRHPLQKSPLHQTSMQWAFSLQVPILRAFNALANTKIIRLKNNVQLAKNNEFCNYATRNATRKSLSSNNIFIEPCCIALTESAINNILNALLFFSIPTRVKGLIAANEFFIGHSCRFCD